MLRHTSVISTTKIFIRKCVCCNLFHKSSKVRYCYSSKKMSSVVSSVKPPNIVVFTGDNQEKVYRCIARNLLRCIHPDKYVVYELKKAQVLVSPWKENVSLLVVFCEKIEETIAEAFREYSESGGNMIVFCSNLEIPKVGLVCNTSKDGLINFKFKDAADAVAAYHGKYCYNSPNATVLALDSDGKPIIMKSTFNEGTLITSEIHLALDPAVLLSGDGSNRSFDEEKCREIFKSILEEEFALELYSLTMPTPTSGYVIVENETALDMLMNKLTINDIPVEKEDKLEKGTDKPPEATSGKKVPLLFESKQTGSILFDKQAYYSKLESKLFGRAVVFFPVVTSTMVPAEYLSDHDGIVVIASRQTCGRGRGDNVWLSPEGCAMFTLHFTLSLSSLLGQRMSIMQHMATLAVVNSISKIPGYENLNLRLKWPNDLYFGNNQKIGGVLVNTTIQGDSVHAYVGIGVNVANERPTVCINSIIKAHNSAKEDNLPALKVEEVISYTLSELECLVDKFMECGADSFLSSYYSYWVHKDQHVTLSSLNKEGVVQGIDDYGFLIVKTGDGKILTLQPDGNRFDIMKNLILARE